MNFKETSGHWLGIFVHAKKTAPKKLGFTLAEVLITLGVIGIVAALTIPPLVANYQKSVYVTQLQKFYAEFQVGAKSYYASQDCQDLKCTGSFDGATAWAIPSLEPNLEDFVSKSFKITKSYGFEGTYDVAARYLAYAWDQSQYCFTNAQYSFMTADGFLVGIQTDTSEGCVIFDNVCATVYVDINGFKGPNIFGRDAFQFYLLNDGSLIAEGSKQWQKEQAQNWVGFPDEVIESATSPYYWRNNPNECGDPASKAFKPDDYVQGIGCAARIMENGWKMDY